MPNWCLERRLVRQHFTWDRCGVRPVTRYHARWQSAASSVSSPGSRRKTLKTRRWLWSAEEDAKLRDLYAQGHTYTAIADALPGRTAAAAALRAAHLLIPTRRKLWSAEEIEKLRAMRAQGYTLKAISEHIPGRSYKSVKIRHDLHRYEHDTSTDTNALGGPSQRRRYPPWTEQEITTLVDMYKAGCRANDICQRLGRTCAAVYSAINSPRVRNRIATLEIPQRHKCTPWTKEDEDELIRLWTSGLHKGAIGSAMGRTEASICLKWYGLPQWRRDGRSDAAATLERPPEPRHRPWMKKDEDELIRLWTSGLGKSAIASTLGRTISSIEAKRHSLRQGRKDGRTHAVGAEAFSTETSQDHHPQVASNAPQPDPQSRRSYSTAHGLGPRLGIDTKVQSTLSFYGSHQLLGSRSWNLHGVFSLPYRPQRRFKHTQATSPSGTKVPFSEEEDRQIVDLRAADYPWRYISESMGRAYNSGRQRGLLLLKEEKWLRRFHEVRSKLRDDQKYTKRSYSAEDDAVILEMKKEKRSLSEIAKALNRTAYSVKARWFKYLNPGNIMTRSGQAILASPTPGATRKNLSAHEDKQLRQMILSGMTINNVSLALGRLPKIISRALMYRGLKARRNYWAESHDQVLRSAIESGKRGDEVYQLLPDQTVGAIWDRCQILGISYPDIKPPDTASALWTAVEDEQLLRLKREGKSARVIAAVLGRTEGALGMRYYSIRSRPTVHREVATVWTAGEDAELLRLRAVGKCFREIGELMDKSVHACRARNYRLRKSSKADPASETWHATQDAELLRLRASGKTFVQIGAIMDRSVRSSCLRHRHLLEESCGFMLSDPRDKDE